MVTRTHQISTKPRVKTEAEEETNGEEKKKKVRGEEKAREEKPEPKVVKKRSSRPEQDLWL